MADEISAKNEIQKQDFQNQIHSISIMPFTETPTPSIVEAIVVYTDEPLSYLTETLTALSRQTHRLDKITLAFTTNSHSQNTVFSESTGQITQLCQRITEESGIPCISLPLEKIHNFGHAINQALQNQEVPATTAISNKVLKNNTDISANSADDTTITDTANTTDLTKNTAPNTSLKKETSWLWLLHADSAPFPDALEKMLKIGESSQLIGGIGPKQVSWQPYDDGSYGLLEVGIKATRYARRVPEIFLGDRDQGQLDRREDVLAIGSAGMLIRFSVFTEIDGFNSDLGPFGDGLEISRRIRAHGYRILVCPAARIRHAQLSLKQIHTSFNHESKQDTAQNDVEKNSATTKNTFEIQDQDLAQSFGARRKAQIFNALLAAPAPLLPLIWIGYLLLAVPRAIVRLIFRDFTRATGELTAGFSVLSNIPKIYRGRQKIKITTSLKKSFRSLEATNKDIRQAKNSRREANAEARKMALLPDPLTLKALQNLAFHQRRGLIFAIFTTFLLSLGFFISFFAAGSLAGGQLATDTSTGTDLWNIFIHSWMNSGDGKLNSVDALWLFYLPILLIFQPLGVTLGLAVTITLYLTPLIGVISAYICLGHFTRSWIIRYIISLLWIISPIFIIALGDGRIGPAIVHSLLPLFLVSFIKAFQKKNGQLGVAALLLAVMSTCAPILLPIGIILAIFTAIWKRSFSWLWLPIPAVAALLPQLAQLKLVHAGTYFVSNPGVPLPNFTSPLEMLKGYPKLAFPNSFWFLLSTISLITLLILAILSLLRNGEKAILIRISWFSAVFGLIGATLILYTKAPEATIDGQLVSACAWHGVFISISWLSLCLILAAGAHGLRTALRKRNFGFSQIIGGIAIISLPLAIIGLATTSLIYLNYSANHTLHAANSHQLPAIAVSNIDSSARSKVLALSAINQLSTADSENGYHAEIWRNNGRQLHEYSMLINAFSQEDNSADPATNDLAKSIADLLTASPNAATKLQAHGISVILVPPSELPKKSVLPHTDATNSQDTKNKATSAPSEKTAQENEMIQKIADIFSKPDANNGNENHVFSSAERDKLISLLHAVPGLEYVTENETGTFWRISSKSGLKTSAKAWIRDSKNQLHAINSTKYGVKTKLFSLPENSRIELAERADDGWHATFNGITLSPEKAANGWAQAWSTDSLPDRTGILQIWHSSVMHNWLVGIQLLISLITIICALPLRARKTGEAKYEI